MLQKLLIALCTIFVLAACGGDLDLGPENPPPQDSGNGDGDGDGDGDDDEEPGEPQIYTDIRFNEEASVETWSYRCVDGCNSTAELSFNADEEVLAIEPEWAGEEDHLEVYTPVDEIFDMEGAAASAWVYVTEDYVTDGNLTMQLLLSNASGATAYTRPVLAASAGWQRLQVWDMTTTTEVDEDEEMEETDEEPAEDYGSFAEYSEGFNLGNINEVGVRFSSNEKSVDVGGQLWIDNVVLTPGPTKELAPLVADMASTNWSLEDGEGLELQREEGVVFFEADGATEYPTKIAYLLDGPIDLVGSSFTIVFSVNQDYIDSGAAIDAIIQESFGDYRDNSGECQVPNADLVAGKETEIVCSDLPEHAVAGEEEVLRVGLQASGVAGIARVHSMEIEGAGGFVEAGPFELTATADNVDSTWDNDNHQSLNGAADLSFNEAEGALAIAPNWDATDNEGNRVVMYTAGEDELPELEGATLGYDLYIPDYYVTEHPGMRYRFFVQQNSGDYVGEFGAEAGYSLDDAEDLGDGWFRFERTFDTVPTEPAALRVGLILLRGDMDNGGEAGEELWLRRITIE